MCHPFDLEPDAIEAVALDFLQVLGDEETAAVGGGTFATTLAVGEEGGCWEPRYPYPPVKPYPQPWPIPKEPPIVTTLALGEEGGVSTDALGEEGGVICPALL